MKRITILSTAILAASSANAAFDEGAAVLFAYNPNNDNTYFVDLEVSARQLRDRVSVRLFDAGLASFIAGNAFVQWSVIGSINDPTPVAGPPNAGQSYIDSGVVSTSTTGNHVGIISIQNDGQRSIMNDWIQDVKAVSNSTTSFGLAGTHPSSANAARNASFFNDSLMGLNEYNELWYAQANPKYGAILSDSAVVTGYASPIINDIENNSCDYFGRAILTNAGHFQANQFYAASCDGVTPPRQLPPVPIPATAWLFGSALLGLVTARRHSSPGHISRV